MLVRTGVRTERYQSATAGRRRLRVDVVRGGEVLDRDPERLVQRHLVGRAPARDAVEQHVAELGRDVVVADRALGPGDPEVSRFVERGLSAIDDQARADDRGGVELASG